MSDTYHDLAQAALDSASQMTREEVANYLERAPALSREEFEEMEARFVEHVGHPVPDVRPTIRRIPARSGGTAERFAHVYDFQTVLASEGTGEPVGELYGVPCTGGCVPFLVLAVDVPPVPRFAPDGMSAEQALANWRDMHREVYGDDLLGGDLR